MADDPKDELFGEPEAEKAEESRSILTDKEIEDAKRIARERIEKALKESEKERIIAEEMRRFQAEEGKRTGKVDLDEEVSVTIDLAEFAAKLTINGQDYWHGYTYTVPRHVYDTMRDIMFRGHLHQNALDGKDLATFYRKKAAPQLSGKVAA
jgi:hypothetical protein